MQIKVMGVCMSPVKQLLHFNDLDIRVLFYIYAERIFYIELTVKSKNTYIFLSVLNAT